MGGKGKIWNLSWGTAFFTWEEQLYREFMSVIEVATSITKEEDTWNFVIRGMYMISSNYFSIQKVHVASFFENLSGGDY
jgi:hypothetical protein